MYEHDPNHGTKPATYDPLPAHRWTYAGGEVIDNESGGVIARAYREMDSPFMPTTRDSNMRHIMDAVHGYAEYEPVRNDLLIPLLLDLEALGFGDPDASINGAVLVDVMQAYFKRLTTWNTTGNPNPSDKCVDCGDTIHESLVEEAHEIWEGRCPTCTEEEE